MKSRPVLAAVLLLCLALTACSKITPENYDRISDGMTEAEVIAILGKPTDSSAVAILNITGTSSTWVGSEYSIMLQFVNGKVRLKSLSRANIR
jgi:hypothetical protein